MAGGSRFTITARLVAVDPPFSTPPPVLFGPQRNTHVDRPRPATGTTTFDIDIDMTNTPTGRDFGGAYVHGRPGDRFLYLSWGLGESADEFTMFARAKLPLGQIPDELLRAAQDGAVLVGELEATNAKGEPASGTIRAPALTWKLGRP